VVVVTILLTLLWIGVAPFYFRIVTNGTIGLWMEKIYNLIDGNIFLNIPILVILMVVSWKLCNKYFKYETTNSSTLWISALGLFVLYYQSPFEYATLFWVIDYRFALSLICVIVIAVWLGKLLDDLSFPKGTYNYPLWHKGFTMDNNNNSIHHSDPVLSYANSIVEKLKYTIFTPNDGSFAIGITSEWGAGKTTFLQLLEEKLKEEGLTDIVSYNPWMCSSPEQVTRDFFATLRNKLSDKYPSLSNPIRKYAKHLSSISLFSQSAISINFDNFASDESLTEMRSRLSEKFAKFEKPVIVIIDDLDRLNSDEVFEVLRLIRNTASISNIIYLVAYDKDYITKILERKDISSPSAYLEKIFQLEIQLPVLTYNQVWDAFKTDLKKQLPEKSDISFISRDRVLIEKVLNTYRRAKRFARLFSLSYDYFSRTESIRKLEDNEILLIDLLHMDDKRVYDILSSNPEKLLDSSDDGTIWIYKKSNDNEYNIELEDETKIKIKDTTNDILKRLWGESVEEPKPYSIRRKEFSEEYFTLNVQFSKKDFDTIIKSKDVDALIGDWHKKGKIPRNFLEKIEMYQNEELDECQRNNLLYGILSYSYYERDYFTPLYKEQSELKENYQVVFDWFDKKMDPDCNYVIIAQLASYLEKIEILDNEKTKKLIQNMVSKQYVYNKADIKSMIEFNGKLYNFISWGFLNHTNGLIAFCHIIDIYFNKKTKPSIDEFCEKYNNSFSKNKDIHPLHSLFGEDWKCCRDIIFLTCVDISRINDYKNNKLVMDILEKKEFDTESEIIKEIEEKYKLKEFKEELRKQIESTSEASSTDKISGNKKE
jgi:hypothetical protein